MSEIDVERLLRIEKAAQELVDEWYSGDEGPRYLALRDALTLSRGGSEAGGFGMKQSVRSTWVNPQMLVDQADAVGSILANRWVTHDPDVYIVIIGPREKAAAFEARLFDYGPPDEAITDDE